VNSGGSSFMTASRPFSGTRRPTNSSRGGCNESGGGAAHTEGSALSITLARVSISGENRHRLSRTAFEQHAIHEAVASTRPATEAGSMAAESGWCSVTSVGAAVAFETT
jgi:hypothetical protein